MDGSTYQAAPPPAPETWSEAHQLAVIAARAVGNLHRTRAGRTFWAPDDYRAAYTHAAKIMHGLGFGPVEGAPVTAWGPEVTQ